MKIHEDGARRACEGCGDEAGLGFELTMAFQPIVRASSGEVFAYEALVRGVNGEGAGAVFAHVHQGNRYRFDQMCRVKAIELAAKLGMQAKLSINFMPNAVYQPELCIRTTLEAAQRFGFPIKLNKTRQAIVRGIIQVSRDLGIDVIGEGVEAREELETLRGMRVDLFQGYYLARPALEALPQVPHEALA
jgi:EAL domain-containing protein (putative c-di-GMP-specific phosphodiesterase class I)